MRASSSVRLSLLRTMPALALFLLVAAPGWGLSLSELLSSSPPRWPGGLLRLVHGPATAGTWSAPAWGDVNRDGRPDLVLGSAYGDVILYPGTEGGDLGPPQTLLQPPLPGQPLRLRPAVPCLAADRAGTAPDLWLLLGDHLVLYRAAQGSFAAGQEVRSREGESLTERLASAGVSGEPVGVAVLPGEKAALVAISDGTVWRIGLSDDLRLGSVQPQTAAGRSLRFSEACRLAVGDLDGDGGLDLVAAGDRRVYLCHFTRFGLSKPALIADGLCTPEALPSLRLTPAVAGAGSLLLGLAWGPVMEARLQSGHLQASSWVMAARAPLDVGLDAAPWACDWDGDGREDVVAGSADGHVRVFLQDSDGLYAPGALVRDAQGVVSEQGKGLSPCFPALADLDGDGDLDLLLGGKGGQVRQWRNDGVFVSLGPVEVAGRAVTGPGLAVPRPLDWDGDGDVDLFVAAHPPPQDWTGRGGPDQYAVPLRFLENPDGRSSPLAFDKMVAVDMFVQRGQRHGDAALLAPWQVLLGSFTGVGQRALLFGRAGLFPFSVATAPPAYPRLVLDADSDDLRPLMPADDIWALGQTNRWGAFFVGLAGYGFVCLADLTDVIPAARL